MRDGLFGLPSQWKKPPRKGFMLWHFEGDRSNQFFKKHNFTTIVHIEPHEKLFSNWKYRKLLAVNDKFKVMRVSDTPLN